MNLLQYDPTLLMAEFAGTAPKLHSVGDAKYHIATTCRRTINGKTIEISLLPNPSHLEAVNPVVTGQVYAQQ
jgi:2-oxoglutarate dehydrogenase E1 component